MLRKECLQTIERAQRVGTPHFVYLFELLRVFTYGGHAYVPAGADYKYCPLALKTLDHIQACVVLRVTVRKQLNQVRISV